MISKKWLILLLGLALVLLAGSMGVTRSSYTDVESSSDNTFQAWSATQWVQTTQPDFEAGVLNQVDTSSSPGDVKLAEEITYNTIASDNFESGGWSGGSGWLAGWWHEGESSITTNGTPHGGSYHLRLRSDDGYVDRAVNLSGQSDVHLQFWAKADSFDAGEFVECYVYDGVDWTLVQTWVDGNDDNVYRFYDIDLSGYSMSSQYYVAFDAEMGDTNDYFYVDDLSFAVPQTGYYVSGTLASQVFDTGISGATWGTLLWDESLPANTDITFAVRASDTLFLKDDGTPSWTSVGGTSPVTSGLPSGRYMQWRATLTTTDNTATPTLSEVRIYYH